MRFAWTLAVGVLLLVTTLAGTSAGRVVALVTMLSALAPTWLIIRAARRRGALLAVSAVVLLALGVALGTIGGPPLARMTSVGARPAGRHRRAAAGARPASRTSVCLQECSRVVHLYAVPDAAQRTGGGRRQPGGRRWTAKSEGGFCRDGFGVAFVDGGRPGRVDAPAAPPGLELLSIETTDCGHA